VLGHLRGDVAGVEVGEDQHARAAGDGAGDFLGLRREGVDGRVGLHLAVDVAGDAEFAGLAAGEVGRDLDLLDRGEARVGGVGRVGEHRDLRGRVGEVAGEAGGGHRDVGELFGGRFRDDAAIREEEDAFDAELTFFGFEDLHRGDRLDALLAGHHLEDGAEAGGRVRGRAGDQGVGAAGGDHQAGEVVRVEGQFGRIALEVRVAVALDRRELLREALEFVAAFGFDEADAFEADVQAGGVDLDALAVADEDRHAELLHDELAGGLDDAGVGAFGEDDALRVVLEAGGKAGNEGHGRWTPVRAGGSVVSLNKPAGRGRRRRPANRCGSVT
jgi:hypothetical protein